MRTMLTSRVIRKPVERIPFCWEDPSDFYRNAVKKWTFVQETTSVDIERYNPKTEKEPLVIQDYIWAVNEVDSYNKVVTTRATKAIQNMMDTSGLHSFHSCFLSSRPSATACDVVKNEMADSQPAVLRASLFLVETSSPSIKIPV